LQINIQDVVTKHHILIKGLVSKGEPRMLLYLTSLLIWTCLICYQGH
jgi:hypothetical protein